MKWGDKKERNEELRNEEEDPIEALLMETRAHDDD